MSRSRRTLLFVFIFLSLNNCFVLSHILPGTPPISTETGPNFKGLIHQPANLKPDLLSAAQRLLAGSQRPINDVSTQPLITKPPTVTTGPLYPQVPVNVNPVSNFPISLPQTNYNTASVLRPPEIVSVDAAETGSPFAVSPVITTLEYPSVDQNYVPLGPISFGTIPSTPSVPEALYEENLIQQPELSQFYQSFTPFTSFTQPLYNIFAGNEELVPVLYPESVNSQQTEISSVEEAVPVDSGLGYPIPLSLQINMPSLKSDQPIILVSTPSAGVGTQDRSYVSPMPPVIPPLIMTGRSRSRWRNLLPILLIALFGNGSCQGSESGSFSACGNSNIPIPYPIPIPTNNPIIKSGNGTKNR